MYVDLRRAKKRKGGGSVAKKGMRSHTKREVLSGLSLTRDSRILAPFSRKTCVSLKALW